MKRGVKRVAALAFALALVLTGGFAGAPQAVKAAEMHLILPHMYQSVYRVYNSANGDHLYTTNKDECAVLINDAGNAWQADGEKAKADDITGTAWYSPIEAYSGTPVWRLYNASNGDHLYTTDVYEAQVNEELGWIPEGICWYSADDVTCDEEYWVPVYRLYNDFHAHSPQNFPGSHHYTTSEAEVAALTAMTTDDGTPIWNYEGIAWYGVSDPGDSQAAVDELRPVLTIEEDGAYAQIEATIIIHETSADGVSAGVVISSPKTGSNLAGLFVQYEENKRQQFPEYTEDADFLLENIYDPTLAAVAGTEGKNYVRLGQAKRETAYKLRLTWSKDGHLRGYVDDKEVTYGYENLTAITMQEPLDFAVNAGAKHGGDVVDVEIKNVKIKVGDGTESFPLGCGLENGWTVGDQDYFGLSITMTDGGTAGSEVSEKSTVWNWMPEDTGTGYNCSFRVTGTSSIPADKDWDTCFEAVEPRTGQAGHPGNATAHIAQTQSEKHLDAYPYQR